MLPRTSGKSLNNITIAAVGHVEAHELSDSDVENGYVTAKDWSKQSDATGAQSPLSESPTYVNGGYAQTDYTHHGKASTGYSVAKAPALALTGYVNVDPGQKSDVNDESKKKADDIIATRALDEAVTKHNDALNAILKANGFINSVSIKSGVTAHIAIFEYIGNDPEILALTRHGYVIVKLPPYIPAEKSILQIHAEQTYQNEFDMVNKIGSFNSDTRPKLLAKCLDGQAFIFNSPIIHDEERFLELRHAALNNNGQDSNSEDEALNIANNYVYNPRVALEGVLQNAFHNLGSFMRLLAALNQDPKEIFDDIFSAMLQAVNELHDHGFVHLDLADRNFVTKMIKNNIKVFLVDFGTADTLCKKTGKSTRNQKYPQTPIMHDANALQLENYTLSVTTDYVSLQKTMLQVIADYGKVDFYKLMIKGLPDAPKVPNNEFLRQFSDRTLINQAISNLTDVANNLIRKNEVRGQHMLNVLEKYKPFFNHDHQAEYDYAALRAANDASFRQCTAKMNNEQQPNSPRFSNAAAIARFSARGDQNGAAVAVATATSPAPTQNMN